MLVDRGTASASEIVTGALQDHHRAKVVGTRTFGKGVFQEVIELSNGGALDITVGQYFTPKGRNLGGKGVKPGPGMQPGRPGRGRPEDRGATRRCDGGPASVLAAVALAVSGTGGRVVGVLAKRGRFLVAEPFFERGQTLVVERDSRAARRRPRRSCARRARAAGTRRSSACSAAPTSRGDVLEALMLDRGLRRRFPPASSARRRRRATTSPRGAESARSDLRDLTTFTIDPATAKDFDDAISRAGARDDGTLARLGAHRRRQRVRARPAARVDREAYAARTSVYVPGAVEPMLPEALSNDACSLRARRRTGSR